MSSDANITIRFASAEDIPALARVWHDGWHSGHAHLSPDVAIGRPFAFFLPRIETALPDCIVATVKDAIVGFASWEGDGIGQVFVLPEWHGKGVAPLVLSAAEQKLREQGHSLIWLQCQIGNTRARRFYEKHGWCVVREVNVSIGTMQGRKPQLVWRMEKNV